MKRDLDALNVFVHVAQLRSFRKAAQQLGVSASALSHAIGKLEQELGVRLLNRTTRSVSPTQSGQRLLSALAPALSEIENALDSLNDERDQVRGRLRLNVPRPVMHLLFAQRLAEWARRYPDLELELVSSDAVIDIVADGFDAGIRFGEMLQQDMVALPIGPPIRFVTCAAPSYLALHGVPTRPDDLLAHQCIALRFPSGVVYRWEYQLADQKLDVATRGSLVLDEMATIVQAAVDGAGLCYTYEAYAAGHLASGRLVSVLPEWMPPAQHFYLYFPSARNLCAALRALIDFLREETHTAATSACAPA